jgi:hypothetical protein
MISHSHVLLLRRNHSGQDRRTWLNKVPDQKDRLVEHGTYDGAYISQLVWLYDMRWRIGLLWSYYTLCFIGWIACTDWNCIYYWTDGNASRPEKCLD